MTCSRTVAALAGATAALALALVLAGCGSDDEAASTTTTGSGTLTVTATETEPTTTETTPAPPPPVTVRIVVREGAPVGGIARPSVSHGDRVVLVVRSDVADHVHVHGYDLFADVTPGGTSQLAFRATIPGRFEIELEDRAVPIAELTVRP